MAGGHAGVRVLLGIFIIQNASAFLAPAALWKSCRSARVGNVLGNALRMQSNELLSDLWLPGKGAVGTGSQEKGPWVPHLSRRAACLYSTGSVLAGFAATPLGASASQGRDLPSLALKAPEGKSVRLSNGGGEFPLVSFGLQVYDDEQARRDTLVALEAGVRNFFASVLAGNQVGKRER
jgi:hypothetical protein